MDALSSTIDLLAERTIKALYDRQASVLECGPHAQGKAQRTESSGSRNGCQGMISHARRLLAGRWLLAEEVHSMALGQQPRNKVTDLAFPAALKAEGAFNQADMHRWRAPYQ